MNRDTLNISFPLPHAPTVVAGKCHLKQLKSTPNYSPNNPKIAGDIRNFSDRRSFVTALEPPAKLTISFPKLESVLSCAWDVAARAGYGTSATEERPTHVVSFARPMRESRFIFANILEFSPPGLQFLRPFLSLFYRFRVISKLPGDNPAVNWRWANR